MINVEKKQNSVNVYDNEHLLIHMDLVQKLNSGNEDIRKALYKEAKITVFDTDPRSLPYIQSICNEEDLPVSISIDEKAACLICNYGCLLGIKDNESKMIEKVLVGWMGFDHVGNSYIYNNY